MLSFSHSGKLGDLIYSLWFVKAVSAKVNFTSAHVHLQTNIPHVFNVMEEEKVMLSEGAAKFLRPLLEAQGWLSVSVGDEVPGGAFDLGNVRKLMYNFSSGDIRTWYLACTNDHVDLKLSDKIFDVPRHAKERRIKDKLMICFTNRYVPAGINFKCLEPVKDRLFFCGLPKEHDLFEQKFFNIDYMRTSDALELAKLMCDCKGVIANLGGNYAVAEALKVPRVCLWPDVMKVEVGRLAGKCIPGPTNVIPQGGWCDVALTNDKLEKLVEELLNAQA